MTPPPNTNDAGEPLEADDAGAEGHDIPPELLELHGLLELGNTAELDAARQAFA